MNYGTCQTVELECYFDNHEVFRSYRLKKESSFEGVGTKVHPESRLHLLHDLLRDMLTTGLDGITAWRKDRT